MSSLKNEMIEKLRRLSDADCDWAMDEMLQAYEIILNERHRRFSNADPLPPGFPRRFFPFDLN